MKLSILIPTVNGREELLERLLTELERQKTPEVEIVTLKDNKEISIGKKRNQLYQMAKGEYSFMPDDDDFIPPHYIEKVLKGLQRNPDCIGYLEECLMDGNVKLACHSNRFDKWADNIHGYDYVRTIYFKDVIKTEIAKRVGVRDMRFGEDNDFSRRLKHSGLLNNEVFINEIMYYYSSQSLSKQQHKERYGIK